MHGILTLALNASLVGGVVTSESLPAELPGLEKAPPFVAEVLITNPQVKAVTFKLYYMPGKLRLESLPSAGSEKQIIISHLAEKVTFIANGEQWLKIPQGALGAAGLDYPANGGGFRTQQLSAKRTIDGKICTGFRLTSPDGKTQIENWLWGDYPVIATVRNSSGTTTAQYRSLRPERTPESFFQLPANAQVQDLGAIGGNVLPDGMDNIPKPADLQQLLKQLE